MSELPLLTFGLAFFIPIGYALVAASGFPADRSRQAAVSVLAALGLSVLGYVITGFALQFGGIGLIHQQPGFDGLIWEWSALGVTWGPGWGMAGLAGWGLAGGAATAEARTVALANLPWLLTATLIPVSALRGRIPAWGTALLGLLTGALIYPLAGNWIWGGGWLANLGANLGLAHGFVDVAGAGLVHLLGAAVTLAGIVAFLPRPPRPPADGRPVPLPEARLPLLSLLGVGLLFAGLAAWLTANPLLPEGIELPRFLLGSLICAAGAALLALGYTWLVAGRADPLMAARGAAAGLTAGLAAAAFIPAWACLVLGALIGLLTPLAIYFFDRIVRWHDPTAALVVHGMGGLLGLLAVGLLADGTAGAGWNGIGGGGYAGVAGQGVTGLLAAAGMRSDFPLQLQAQLFGAGTLALFGFFAAWLILAPLATAVFLLRPRQLAAPVAQEQTLREEPAMAEALAAADEGLPSLEQEAALPG